MVGKSWLPGPVQTLLLDPHEHEIGSGERPDDEQKQENEAGPAKGPDLRLRLLPGNSFPSQLYLQHLEKFLRFLLAVGIGL